MNIHWNTGLPDSDTTVLMRVSSREYPVWPGYRDGECWRFADGTRVSSRVLGWMHLDAAAKALGPAGNGGKGK